MSALKIEPTPELEAVGVAGQVKFRQLVELLPYRPGQDDGDFDAGRVHRFHPRIDLVGSLRVDMRVNINHRKAGFLDVRFRNDQRGLGGVVLEQDRVHGAGFDGHAVPDDGRSRIGFSRFFPAAATRSQAGPSQDHNSKFAR